MTTFPVKVSRQTCSRWCGVACQGQAYEVVDGLRHQLQPTGTDPTRGAAPARVYGDNRQETVLRCAELYCTAGHGQGLGSDIRTKPELLLGTLFPKWGLAQRNGTASSPT
jgi:hypothetical protein